MRNLRSVLAAGLIAATLVVVAAASPAGAAPVFFGTRAPLQAGGTEYSQPDPANSTTGAWYVATDGAVVFAGTSPAVEIPAFGGIGDVHVGLTTFDFGAAGTRSMTVFVEDGLFSSAVGGPYAASCAGFDTLFESLAPNGLVGSTCAAFKTGILSANGPGANYDFNGFGGFTDAGGGPLAPDPNVATGDHSDPAIIVATYQGNAAPLSYGGTAYIDSVTGEPGGGSGWLPVGSPPFFATSGPRSLPMFPTVSPGGEIASVHALLVQAGGQKGTIYVDGALFYLLDAQNPFTADCPGFQDFLTAVSATGITCDAFRADVFSAPAAVGGDYACDGIEGGWTDTNGDPLDGQPTVTDGFDLPALTPIGLSTGPGVCVLADTVQPEPTTTTTPTTTTPTSTTPAAAPGARPPAARPASATPPSTLPATGSSSWALVLAGALAVGLGALAMALRPRFSPAGEVEGTVGRGRSE